jgi:hypothetical protein
MLFLMERASLPDSSDDEVSDEECQQYEPVSVEQAFVQL